MASRNMSKFVNYKKRGISLPAGCKELIDLLEPSNRRKVNDLLAPSPDVKVARDDSFISNLSDIGKPITWVCFEKVEREIGSFS